MHLFIYVYLIKLHAEYIKYTYIDLDFGHINMRVLYKNMRVHVYLNACTLYIMRVLHKVHAYFIKYTHIIFILCVYFMRVLYIIHVINKVHACFYIVHAD